MISIYRSKLLKISDNGDTIRTKDEKAVRIGEGVDRAVAV
jgi:hypothetical protein